MKEKTENTTKFLQAVARMRASGIVVADKTRKGGGMGLVGEDGAGVAWAQGHRVYDALSRQGRLEESAREKANAVWA